MIILGIETSGFSGSVALWKDDGDVVERSLPKSGRRHAQSLVQEISQILEDEKIARDACDAVAVSIGPGSFTGLRVGVVAAKTWAYATGCDLIAVDTFQAIAANNSTDVGELSVIADAQRGDIFIGNYQRNSAGSFRRIGEIEIVAAESWFSKLDADDIVSGPGIDKWEDLLRDRCRLIEPERRFPNSEHVANIAADMWKNKELADSWSLEPFYLRRSAAEEKWDTANPNGTHN